MTVYQQQCLLGYLGYSVGIIDGVYGGLTGDAIRKFQSDYCLTVDGVCGATTEKMLLGVVAGTVARKDVAQDVAPVQVPVQVPVQTGTHDASQFLQSDGYYHIPKTQHVKLSKNFDSYEFRCGIGRTCGTCTETLINPKLVKILQDIRDHFGSNVTITSAYRCPSYNGSIGGATGSRHTKGDAADITVSGHSPRTVARYAEEIGVQGIGLYETSADGFFVHIDTRDAKSFWFGQAQQYRNTFK